MNTYTRDRRSPIPKNENVSKIMSANKAQGTKPELMLRKALWSSGFRGYRLHKKNIPGRPDIVFGPKKVALFVNGCFWHRCPHCKLPLPKNNQKFWSEKFSKNKERDMRIIADLKELGWDTIIIWECELKTDVNEVINKIKLRIGK